MSCLTPRAWSRSLGWPSGLSHKLCEGVLESSAVFRKDAQQRRTRRCVKAEDTASVVEGRGDTAIIGAAGHEGLSHKWCEGVLESSAVFREDAQQRRTRRCGVPQVAR